MASRRSLSGRAPTRPQRRHGAVRRAGSGHEPDHAPPRPTAWRRDAGRERPARSPAWRDRRLLGLEVQLFDVICQGDGEEQHQQDVPRRGMTTANTGADAQARMKSRSSRPNNSGTDSAATKKRANQVAAPPGQRAGDCQEEDGREPQPDQDHHDHPEIQPAERHRQRPGQRHHDQHGERHASAAVGHGTRNAPSAGRRPKRISVIWTRPIARGVMMRPSSGLCGHRSCWTGRRATSASP